MGKLAKINNHKSYEEKLIEKQKTSQERNYIKTRAVKEWPTIRQFTQALRYLEIFAQLMKIKSFLAWMKAHIEIHDQVDETKKTIDTYVMYRHTPKSELIKALDVPDTENENETEVEQNIIRCPGCGVSFDANVQVSSIQLATEMPKAPLPDKKR